jgi:hypothetical protein
MAAHQDNRELLELFTTIAAGASNPGHAFITQRYTANLATLAAHLQEAVDAGDIIHLSPTLIEIEERLLTAMMDGIGLQWLLNPETDIRARVSAYVERAIAAWEVGNSRTRDLSPKPQITTVVRWVCKCDPDVRRYLAATA